MQIKYRLLCLYKEALQPLDAIIENPEPVYLLILRLQEMIGRYGKGP